MLADFLGDGAELGIRIRRSIGIRRVLLPGGGGQVRTGRGITVAVATIDLGKRYLDTWLGDMRARFMKELRLETAVDPPGRR